jgi:gluconolactonase
MDSVFCEGLAFPEGPAFDSAGNLYVVETAAGQISRVTPAGERSVLAATGGGPNGIAIGKDGALYVTNNGGLRFGPDGRSRGLSKEHAGGWIERVSPGGQVDVLYRSCDGQPLNSPNDIVADPDGNLYFTDPSFPTREGLGPGHVYFAAADGSRIKRVDSDYKFSNGIGLTDEGRTLVVAESFTSTLWAYSIEAPGRLSGKRQFAQLPEGHLPDGFCFDAEGNCICAGAEGGALSVFAPDGRPIDCIEVEDPLVTNAAFGGPDYSTLYITESTLGRVVTIPWRVPGARLFPR